jgi:hypothetical protein
MLALGPWVGAFSLARLICAAGIAPSARAPTCTMTITVSHMLGTLQKLEM